MITYIEGTVKSITADLVLVVTNNIGYSVRVGQRLLVTLNTGDQVALYLDSFLRDDHFELYGFINEEELKMFQQLLSVSGVGPKMAVAVLNHHDVETIRRGILADDTALFTGVSGIGKKNASRIILELKSKMSMDYDVANLTKETHSEELKSALRSLGYSVKEIDSMIKDIPSTLTIDEQIKQALRET